MSSNKIQHGKDLLVTYDTNPTDFIMTSNFPTFSPEYGHNFPLFRLSLVPTMKMDPRIRYGLNLLKGPIQAFTAFVDSKEAENPQLHETIREQGIQFVYGVECEDEEIKKFILQTLGHLWQDGLQEMMLALDWGFSVCQVMYKKGLDGKINYSSMKHIHPFNIQPKLWRDQLVGARVRGIPGFPDGQEIQIPKIMWHVHERSHHPLHGQSRLAWAFVPWHETWVCYGARDIRRTWFYRNAYDGGVIRYPIGTVGTKEGTKQDNKSLAISMMANRRTGGFLVFPNEFTSDQKTQKWVFEPPTASVTPQGLMEYPEVLRMEMLEAMGIPPDVVEGGDGGLGSSSGREVPLQVYYSSLAPLVNNIINDFRKFVLDYLIFINFKKKIDYKVTKVIPLKSVPPEPPKTPGAPAPKAKAKKPAKPKTESKAA